LWLSAGWRPAVPTAGLQRDFISRLKSSNSAGSPVGDGPPCTCSGGVTLATSRIRTSRALATPHQAPCSASTYQVNKAILRMPDSQSTSSRSAGRGQPARKGVSGYGLRRNLLFLVTPGGLSVFDGASSRRTARALEAGAALLGGCTSFTLLRTFCSPDLLD